MTITTAFNGMTSANDPSAPNLEHEHHEEAIRTRLQEKRSHSYLGDAVLGGIDGCVTTFAVVSGAVGGGFSSLVILVLGFANLIADGFSMAVSNYQNIKSEREQLDRARQMEAKHIRHVPDGEREEVRQIFAQKGFEGDVLDNIVAVITSDERLWIDTMLTEELGLRIESPHPLHAAMATFGAFLVVGLVPLLPFVLPIASDDAFPASIAGAAVAFFAVGWGKGLVLGHRAIRSGLETLLTGGAAAFLAYGIGAWLRIVFGTGVG